MIFWEKTQWDLNKSSFLGEKSWEEPDQLLSESQEEGLKDGPVFQASTWWSKAFSKPTLWSSRRHFTQESKEKNCNSGRSEMQENWKPIGQPSKLTIPFHAH